MAEESERQGTPLWSGWAVGMLVGLIAIIGMGVAMGRYIMTTEKREHLYAEFRDTCAANAELQANVIVPLTDDNAELRQALRLPPREYPTTLELVLPERFIRRQEAVYSCDPGCLPPEHDQIVLPWATPEEVPAECRAPSAE